MNVNLDDQYLGWLVNREPIAEVSTMVEALERYARPTCDAGALVIARTDRGSVDVLTCAALDGDAWRFGDDSVPTAPMTWFAGTFVRHPLSLAAAKATLEHLIQEGRNCRRG